MKGVWVFFRLDNHLRVQRNSSVSSERWRWIFLRYRIHVAPRDARVARAPSHAPSSVVHAAVPPLRSALRHTHTKKKQEHETCVVRK